MEAFRPDAEKTEGLNSDRNVQRGRARQRHMARQLRHEPGRIVQQRAAGREPGIPFSSRVADGAAGVLQSAQDWLGRISWRRLRSQGVVIVPVLIGLVLLFTALSTYTSGNVLPGVSVAGISVAGLTEQDAAEALKLAWENRQLTLKDGERIWTVPARDLGFRLDAAASARRAMAYGHEQGGLGAMISAALGGVNLEPVVDLDLTAARDALVEFTNLVNVPAANATVRVQGVVVTHIPAQPGRRLNISELLPMLAADPVGVVEKGTIDLPMNPVPALILDATPLVEYAQNLLERDLVLEAYDPVADESHTFSVPPQEWGRWLDTQLVYHDTGPRLYLSVAAAPVREFLVGQAETLPDPLTLDLGDGVRAIQQAVMDGSLNTWVTVRYEPIVYTVGRGETAYGISRTTGIPYYLIEQANPDRNLSELYVGDTIIIPSRDSLLPLRPVRNKRIVVDLSDQYLWAYENGQPVYEWPISSGIASAPTATGVFQILSHEEKARGSSYTLCDADTCGQWVMSWFMGIYEAVPGLMNGFHGAVELPNGRYLGDGQVGRPFTFGCIMSQEDNAILLYNWAEEGTVVEVRQ